MASASTHVPGESFPLKLQRNVELLALLGEPRLLYQALLWCNERPRPSAGLEAFAGDLLEVGRQLGCQVEKDGAGNVVWRHPGTSQREGVATVCLQAHQDMVCSANDGTVFDFAREPIRCVLSADGRFLKAEGTTLGADNAVGIAACMALLSDPGAAFPPLECVFTADEETTMSGAEGLAPAPFLKAAYLLNLDSEEHGSVCVGCAGGFEAETRVPVQRTAAAEGAAVLALEVDGLCGGHTGVDIHRGRANAVLLVTRLLSTLPGLRLQALSGGSVVNTIPRSAQARLVCATQQDAAAAEAIARAEWEVVCKEYHSIESALTLKTSTTVLEAGAQHPCDEASSQLVVDFLSSHPHGPLRVHPHNPAEVATSISLSIVALHDDHLLAHPFARSDSAEQMDLVYRRLASLARLAGGSISDKFNVFPGWAPNIDSPAFRAVFKSAETVYGHPPRVYSVHAGLEVGFFAGVYPHLHCASFGPEINDAHTPDERLLLSTVQPFYDLLKLSLQTLTENQP